MPDTGYPDKNIVPFAVHANPCCLLLPVHLLAHQALLYNIYIDIICIYIKVTHIPYSSTLPMVHTAARYIVVHIPESTRIKKEYVKNRALWKHSFVSSHASHI